MINAFFPWLFNVDSTAAVVAVVPVVVADDDPAPMEGFVEVSEGDPSRLVTLTHSMVAK